MDIGSRAIVMAAFLVCHDKPQTSSWLAAVVELCRHVLWMGEWTGVHPPRDGQLRSAPPLALLACWPLHGRSADLLRAVHVQASYLQPLTAWNRQTRAAEQLECCCGCAWRRAARGVPPTTVEPTRGRSSTVLGLGRAHLIRLPALGAQDRMAAPVVAVITMCLNNTYRS